MPVMHRSGMKRTVSEKYIDIFKWYEADLEEVKEMYEKNKVSLTTLIYSGMWEFRF